MRYIMCLALAVIVASDAVPALAGPASALKVEWYTLPSDPCRSYCVGDVRGVWCHVSQTWREWSFDKFQHEKTLAQCPVVPPKCGNDSAVSDARIKMRAGGVVLPSPVGPPAMPEGRKLPTGMSAEPLSPSPGYWRNGERVSRDDVLDAIKSRVPASEPLRRITVIGTATERTAALRVIGEPAWATVKAYDPQDWYIAHNGFVAAGHPTVYVQEPDGKVIHRQDDLAGLAQAVERADPNYDPTKDPDLRKPQPKPNTPVPGPVGPGILDDLDWKSMGIGGAVAGVLLFLYSLAGKMQPPKKE